MTGDTEVSRQDQLREKAVDRRARAATLPFRMTGRTADAEDMLAGDSLPVIALTRQFTAYLDLPGGLTVEERRQQLADVDKRAYEAYELRLQRKSPSEIAELMGVSPRTARRLLACAYGFMQRGTEGKGDSYEAKLEALQIRHPEVYRVYIMRLHGWSVTHIAGLVDLSEAQVSRLSLKARDWLGAEDGRVVRRHAKTTLAEIA